MLHLHRTRLKIEKAVYDNGINVALFHAENSDEYKAFEKDLEFAFITQINEAVEFIDDLLLHTKAENSLIKQIGTIITSIGSLVGMNSFLRSMGNFGGQAGLDKLDIQGKFVLQNQDLIRYFDDHSRLLITSLDNTTAKWLANKIQTGRANLQSPNEIVVAMLDEGVAFSRVRAEMIVLTETANALSIVEMEVATKYGIKEIIWRTSVDERVCPICMPLEGSKTVIGKNFVEGVKHPPAHPRCRCFLEEVIPDNWNPSNYGWLGE